MFAYDGANLIEETSSTGAVVARYEQTENIDEPLAMLGSSATSYYHADGLGSITSLSNSAGAIANTYTYDSYGNLTTSTGSLVNSFRYTGREFDSETNLYYYRARYYDSNAGRFLSEDPIGFDGGNNLYDYVANSSANSSDPLGLKRISIGTIRNDENTALNIMARPKCSQFILDTIQKTYTYLNNQALSRGYPARPDTLKAQGQSIDIGNFARTLLESDISITNRHPNYGAHVGFAGGWTIYIDLGYAGPLDLVHETFHVGRYGFSDIDLARALGAPFVVDPRDGQKTVENASVAWNCRLEQACK